VLVSTDGTSIENNKKKRRFLVVCVDAGNVRCVAVCGCSSLSSWMALDLLVVVALVAGCMCGGCGDA
jgi:hypothetical protein